MGDRAPVTSDDNFLAGFYLVKKLTQMRFRLRQIDGDHDIPAFGHESGHNIAESRRAGYRFVGSDVPAVEQRPRPDLTA